MSMDIVAKEFQIVKSMYEQFYNRPREPEPIEEKNDIKCITDNFLLIDRVWKDALAVLETNQFYAISIVGPQGSGKTTIAEEIVKRALDKDFKIVYSLPADFIYDIEGWIKKATENPRAKNCLIIDDLSYTVDMQTRKNQALIKNIVSRFRHIFGGQLLVVYITHRLHAAPPMLRNSSTWIFTSMQSIDRDDASKIIGRSKEMRDRLNMIYEFITNVCVVGAKKSLVKFSFSDGRDLLFRWGRKDDVGDGRLMASYHSGNLNIFNARVSPGLVDLEKYRFKATVPNGDS